MTSNAEPSPDRGHLETEKRLASAAAIDALSIGQALQLINTQDIEVPRAVRAAVPALTKLIETIVAGMKEGGRLIYVGAGTSGRLGVLDASECPPTFFTDPGDVVGIIAGGDKALRKSAEGKEDDPTGSHLTLTNMDLGPNDTLVGIAAGGTTPFVWGAIEFARKRGCPTGIITCVKLSALRKPKERAPLVPGNAPVDLPPPPEDSFEVDHAVELIVGPEVVTGSTRLKAGTATKLALNMITTATMVQLGKTWGNLMVDLRATNAKLVDRAQRILVQQLDVTRGEASRLLDAADGRVKLALVMHRRQLDAAAAEALIDEHGGRLRPILGSPK
ncbi:MAG: N-acetylmuramic acid 6-phosphate etherase [Planctomycetota bacterium]